MTTIHSPAAPAQAIEATRQLDVEFLFLDLQTCARCVGTEATLQAALDLVRPALAVAGIEVKVTQRLVESEADARRFRFVSSPTIRINGLDIAGELVESTCDSCSDLCACNGSVDCRVWRYRGQDYTEAPTGLIVEALLRHAATPASVAPKPFADVPENLKQFFRSRSGATGQAAVGESLTALECCPVAEQATCCEASEKSTCCGAAVTGQAAGSCGCREN